MPDNTTVLSLPLIQPSQAQKHVTHNEALRVLDVAVQLAVTARDLAAPPASPVSGARYIVAAGASGAWAGQAGKVALYANALWEFHTPLAGWQAFILAEGQNAAYDGSAWTTLAEGALSVGQIGVSAVANGTNRLSVSSPAVLLNHAGAGHQVKINKASAADTASLMFQTGFSGRAEMGTTGSDNFTIKVSPNGSTFYDGVVIDKDNGKVTAMQGFGLQPMATDLAAPANGDLWYNSATGKFRARQAGATVDLIGSGGGGGGTVFSDATFALQDDADASKQAAFQLSGIATATTRTYTMPDASGELALLSGTQTFAGATTVSGTFTVSAASATLGNATGTATYGIGAGATLNAVTKTVNIGTAGVSGSNTVVNVGSTVAGAAGSLVVNTPTVTFANAVTSVAMPEAVVGAKYLGLGGAAGDATNRLSVNTPAVLFNHAGASVEASLNKAATGNDAAIAFKNGFSGRALAGLLANDDFTLKVSANGSTYFDALRAAAASGVVTLAQPVILAGQAADPGSPSNGMLWYNSTTGQARARINGKTAVFGGAPVMPWMNPPTGEYVLTTCGSGAATTTIAGAAGRLDIYPFVPRGEIVLDRIAINVTTLIAGSLAKVVIYGSDANGRPNDLILETGDLDCATTGVKTATVSLTMSDRRAYWIGIRHSSTATLSAWASAATPDINGGTAPVTSARKILRRTLTYATAAPATWGFLSSEINSSMPTAIWLRVV